MPQSLETLRCRSKSLSQFNNLVSSASYKIADTITPACKIYEIVCLPIITLSARLSVVALFQLIAEFHE